jgi:hypothetical protein
MLDNLLHPAIDGLHLGVSFDVKNEHISLLITDFQGAYIVLGNLIAVDLSFQLCLEHKSPSLSDIHIGFLRLIFGFFDGLTFKFFGNLSTNTDYFPIFDNLLRKLAEKLLSTLRLKLIILLRSKGVDSFSAILS